MPMGQGCLAWAAHAAWAGWVLLVGARQRAMCSATIADSAQVLVSQAWARVPLAGLGWVGLLPGVLVASVTAA